MVRRYLLLPGLLFLMPVAVWGDVVVAAVEDPQQVIRDRKTRFVHCLDSKTRIMYYLESDLRHVAALTPNGGMLWRCDAVPPASPAGAHVISLALSKSDKSVIEVGEILAGPACGEIDKKTGHYLFKGED